MNLKELAIVSFSQVHSLPLILQYAKYYLLFRNWANIFLSTKKRPQKTKP